MISFTVFPFRLSVDLHFACAANRPNQGFGQITESKFWEFFDYLIIF